MSFPLLDVVRRSGGRLALLVALTLGVTDCVEDNTIYDYFPTVCETNADCRAQVSCRVSTIAVCYGTNCACEEPPREPMCGNGEIEDGEDCDDGNDVSGDGCEPDCTHLILAIEPKCLASTPVLDDVGRFIPDERGDPTIASTTITNLDSDGSCTFYVACPIGTRAALPLTVWPMAPFISREGRSRVPLDQALSLTAAIRADRPELAFIELEFGYVRFAPSTRDPTYSPFYTEFFGLTEPIPLPLPGDPAQRLSTQSTVWELEDDGTSGFSIDWLRVELFVESLGEKVECLMIGEASVVYLPEASP